MQVDSLMVHGALILRIAGPIDSSTSGVLEQAVGEARERHAPRMLLDMRAVDYVSSAGLRVVLMAAKQMRAAQGGFAIFGMRRAVRTIFEISGFLRVLHVVDTEAEALAVTAEQPA